MRFPLVAFGLSVLLTFTSHAQTIAAPTQTTVAAAPAYVAGSLGPHSQVWSQVTWQTNELGAVSASTNAAYTEVATGLNFLNAANQWAPASEQIDILATGGASATHGQHQVFFPPDISTGQIVLTLPDGRQLHSRPVGLAYFDGTNSVLFAQLTNAPGYLFGNQIIYSNCFVGGVNASVRYTYTKSSFEQDIILQDCPLPPSQYNLSASNCALMALTEFFDPPQPSVVATTTTNQGAVSTDDSVDWGSMRLAQGKAFALGQPSDADFTTHTWQVLDGRQILVEQIPFTTIAANLDSLAPHQTSLTTRKFSHLASNKLQLPPPRHNNPASTRNHRLVRLAENPLRSGCVLDYVTVNGTMNNYTFMGSSTYYVSANVVLTGTPTFEGGTCIKYATNTSISIGSGVNPNWLGKPYLPVVLTSMDDKSCGAAISGGTGNVTNYYANPALSIIGPSVTITNFRIVGAQQAILLNGGSDTFYNGQIVNCSNGVWIANASVALRNMLFANVTTNLNRLGGATIDAENVTFGGSTNYPSQPSILSAVDLPTKTYTLNCTNCIIANMTSFLSGATSILQGLNNGFYNNASSAFGSSPISTTTQPFQHGYAGFYYLALNSGFSGMGTTSIDPILLAGMAQRTTAAPIIYTNLTISSTTYWNPTVRGDVNIPDLGYYYDPIDYLVSALKTTSSVILTNGVALGCFGTGIEPATSAFISQGAPNNMNHIFWYPLVQEQPVTLNGTAVLFYQTSGANHDLTLRFTDVPMQGGGPACAEPNSVYLNWNFTDCRFENAVVSVIDTSGSANAITIGNSDFERCNLTFVSGFDNPYQIDLALNLYNNLFWSNTCSLTYDAYSATYTPAWTFTDNLLDGTTLGFTEDGTYSSYLTVGHNAFNNTANPLGGSANITNTALSYATGPFGTRYINSSTPTLVDQGSRTAAAAGLYHYTMFTTLLNGLELPETNTQVDIGVHFIATDAEGNPLDTAGDSIPDYVKDANGDGVFDAGDLLDWQFPFYIYDQGQTYGGYTPNNLRLGYWRFNNTSLSNESGQMPIASNDFRIVTSWSTNAVSFTNSDSQLAYYVVSNGWENINPSNGTIRFWYQPTWSTAAANHPPLSSQLTFINFGTGGDSFTFWIDCDGHSNTSLSLSSSTSQFSSQDSGYFDAPIAFQSNRWYQVALTYSPSNIACYLNGTLAATAYSPPMDRVTNGPQWEFGDGLAIYPANVSAGFYLGNEYGGTVPILGQIDELETFNYPLTAEAIAYGYPTFAGCSTNNALDSDYDGRSDLLETLVDGTNSAAYNSGQVVPCRLGYWRFDTTDLTGEQGQYPLSATNVTLVPSWSGTALNISSAANSHVTYSDVSSNGWANINCRQGSIRFWFKPNWNTTSGGTFLFLGNTNVGSGYGQWSLDVNSSSGIELDTATNGGGDKVPLQSSTIPFSSSHWMQIVLTYGSNGTSLYTNGTLALNGGAGVTQWPDTSDRSHGLVIGNNSYNDSPLNGQIDELETFNYQLTAAQIATNFLQVQAVDSDLDGIPDLLEDKLFSTNRPFLGRPVVITGCIEAEQFDLGSNGVAYSTANGPRNTIYRPGRMIVNPCNDLGGGYCLDQTHAGEWTKYSVDVLVPQTYVVEVRAQSVGTNLGGVFQCDFTNGVGALTNSAGFTNSTSLFPINNTNWTIYSSVVYLPTNTTTMRLRFLSNATNGTGCVGRFNYISIYPWWPPPTVGPGITNVILSAGTNWSTATNNAHLIQSALNSLLATGGLIQLQSGTYYLAQGSPNEAAPQACNNAAVAITGNNITVAGAGKTSTTLTGYNRATTLFSIGADNQSDPYQVTNFILRDLTIQAQPHLAVLGITNNTGALSNDPAVFIPSTPDDQNINVFTSQDAGTPVVLYPISPTQWNYNVLFTNLQFIDAYNQVVIEDAEGGSVSNILVTACNFDWDGANLGNVGIFLGGVNLVIVSNSCNGNTNLIAFTNNGVNSSSTGLVWNQAGGNCFIARNVITNYAREGVQVQAGPNAVVGNNFSTLESGISVTALSALGGGYPGATGTNEKNLSTCFVGNNVFGGRWGVKGFNDTNVLPYSVNFFGNSLMLYPAYDEAGDYPGAAVFTGYHCFNANVAGNTLVSGGHGLLVQGANHSALILNNNLSGATYRGIGYYLSDGSLTNAQIYGNILGEGASFHAQVPYADTFGWFFKQNTFLDSYSNSIAPFLDPLSAAVHLNP